MKTLICLEPNDMVYVDRDMPVIKSNEVLLKIRAVGICGTDIHAYAGRQPFFSYPRVLGHEISGEVIELGSACSKLELGDRACVIPCIPCGTCPACKVGKTNCCENVSLYGVHQDGGFTQYLAVYEDNLIRLDSSLSDSAGALVECFAIGAHAIRRAAPNKGENLLQIGAGPIGIAAAAVAKADGANVVVADISAERRAHIGKVLGVPTINPLDEDYIETMKGYFNGELATTVIDATGNKQSMSNTVNLINNGGKIVFVGLYIGNLELDDPSFHRKETTLMSSRNATAEDFEKVIRLMKDGAISESMMKSHDFDFDTVGHHYVEQVVQNKNLVKGVINFN